MALFLLCLNLGWIQGQFNFTELSLRYHQGLEVLLLQAIEQDLVCRPMRCGVDTVAPLQELPVHVVEG